MMERRVRKIMSIRIARELIETGVFKLLTLEKNKVSKERTVFVFESTEELNKHLKDKYNI